MKHANYNVDRLEYKGKPGGVVLGPLDPVFPSPSKIKFGYAYRYNGQEWQDELGLNMYDMDMRQYDPAIGRWVVQDPVVHHNMSPYNAFDNNPVYWADPSGADAVYNWDTGKYMDGDKEVTFQQALAGYGISLDGNPPKWVQKYNDWTFINVTVNAPNWWPGNFPFDARGYELFQHWTNGTGRDLNYNEGNWGEYMRANEIINEFLLSVSHSLASSMLSENKTSASDKSGNFHMEIQNGYYSGYELLHGTIYFSYEVNGKYNSSSDSYTFDYSLRWHDRINANAAQGDKPLAETFKWAKDYNITINWSQSIHVNKKDVQEYNIINGTSNRGTRGYRR